MSSLRSQNRPAALVACSTKRRRRTATYAAAATREDSSSWASLPEDLVSLIGWRVLAGDFRDYIRFRAVCPHWRSSTACPRGRGIVDPRFHPRRWMMLPEGHGLYPGHDKLHGFVRFFNLSTGAFVRVRLPLFRDHCALDSIDGILLLQRDHDTAIRLLHPFTGDIADFPPLETLLPYVNRSLLGDKWQYLRQVTAASISVTADDQAVSLTMWLLFMVHVSFATSGDKRWRMSSWSMHQIYNPLSFQGKLYVFHQTAAYGEPEVLQINPPQKLEGTTELSLPPPKSIAKCPASTPNALFLYYLVDCGAEILVITLGISVYAQISVYRLADLVLGMTVPVTCIGCNSLFLGKRNLCVSSKAFSTIGADTVVFYHRKDNHLAQYHL